MRLEQIQSHKGRVEAAMKALVADVGSDTCSSVGCIEAHVFGSLRRALGYLEMLEREAESHQPADCAFDLRGQVAA